MTHKHASFVDKTVIASYRADAPRKVPGSPISIA